MKFRVLLLLLIFASYISAQVNITVTNPEADSILLNQFDPGKYTASDIITDHTFIDSVLVSGINADSLRSYLEVMQRFKNRNTGSDTVSAEVGIGAARRWAYSKFEEFSTQNENRLITSYLQFDQVICGMGRHKNVLTILPGSSSSQELVIVEAHFDSRCEDRCDTDCLAEGMEDNGSGSALVMELARVLAPFTFDRTIVFMLTTGEEQGLLGANAFSQYAVDNNIGIKGVLNNDVIGGIVCGETASPPGCPGLNDIDSINVRIFSAGTIDSPNKQLARYVNLQFMENTRPMMSVKPVVRILTPEDRTGRGGDHIPFREDGFAAIRFTSANEHGDADASDPEYHDRQHSIRDILGLDTDNDGNLDSFFVDFNYLARNAIINGSGLIGLAGCKASPFDLDIEELPGGFSLSFNDTIGYPEYRVAVRPFDDHHWDTLFTIYQTTDTIMGLPADQFYAVSVMGVLQDGLESLPSNEEWGSFPSGLHDIYPSSQKVELLQNRPNPFDEATVIGVNVIEKFPYQDAHIRFTDMQGKLLTSIPLTLNTGLNEVVYDYRHHHYQQGTYWYSLVVDDRIIESKAMVYAY